MNQPENQRFHKPCPNCWVSPHFFLIRTIVGVPYSKDKHFFIEMGFESKLNLGNLFSTHSSCFWKASCSIFPWRLNLNMYCSYNFSVETLKPIRCSYSFPHKLILYNLMNTGDVTSQMKTTTLVIQIKRTYKLGKKIKISQTY